MPLIEIVWPSAIAVLALMLAGHSSGGSKPPSPLPLKLQYSFGSNSLVRDSEYIAVVTTPTWDNAQVPPPAGFEATPCARLISIEDFTRLWQELNKIDLTLVTNPGDDAFEHTPPDKSHVEALRLITDGRTMIEWAKPDYQLKADIRKPLEAFADSLKILWALRSKELVYPKEFYLELSIVGLRDTSGYRFDWSPHGAAIYPLGKDVGIGRNPEQCKAFWSDLAKENVLGRSYQSTSVREPGKSLYKIYSMRAVVNRVTVLDFKQGEKFVGRDVFDSLYARLESVGKWQKK